VQALLEVRLEGLADRTSWSTEPRVFADGVERRVVYYDGGSHKVWGATAFVLSELAAMWLGLSEELGRA
jgi:hypothetical protein